MGRERLHAQEGSEIRDELTVRQVLNVEDQRSTFVSTESIIFCFALSLW